jgi:transcriptional regulator with XRE-family HTH domain
MVFTRSTRRVQRIVRGGYPLTPWERQRGERFGALLRQARGDRSMVEVAAAAGVSAETLRKIETGRAPTPAFFTVVALAAALGVSLDGLAAACVHEAGKASALGVSLIDALGGHAVVACPPPAARWSRSAWSVERCEEGRRDL